MIMLINENYQKMEIEIFNKETSIILDILFCDQFLARSYVELFSSFT